MDSSGPRPRGLARGFEQGRAALVTYLVAGYPDRDTSLECLRAAARAGADVIELGVPFRDPLADGPVIAEAAKAAMEAAEGSFGLAETLALAHDFLAEDHENVLPPVAIMTYLNPMLRAGLSHVVEQADLSHVSGFIVPDMPADSPFARQWVALAEPLAIDTVFLVAPTSTPDRIAVAAGASTGFVYCVASVGVTGERAEMRDDLEALVESTRAVAADTPVVVGFGIGTPEQAAEVARFADGVVVGSAVVKRQKDPAALESFVSGLREALDPS